MSTIEKAFKGKIKYLESVEGQYNIWKTFVPQSENLGCNQIQQSSFNLLDSSKYKLMEESVASTPLYFAKQEILSHIAISKVETKLHEDLSVIFVANKDNYVKKLSILPGKKESCLIEVNEM